MSHPKQYDYIIAGAGCAGLSLLVHMIESGKLKHKKVLLLDNSRKNKNDRTWCFWEKEQGLFESIVFKEWKQLSFYSDDLSKNLHIDPYTYKLIRGIDFYDYCFQKIKSNPNIDFKQTAIREVVSNDKETFVATDDEKFCADYIFNSVLFQKPQLSSKQYWLLQHFKGLVVETKDEVFDPSAATLMDFRTDQSEGASFFYVLPFTAKKALIEYTVFSANVLREEDYDRVLTAYIVKNFGNNYTVLEKEFGIIPMTNFSFESANNNIINIGTAGGQTKGSSGYTFKFVQKHSAAIVQSLINKQHPAEASTSAKRFSFYDSILLNILHHRKMPGDKIFSQLFEKNRADLVLKFLDNETSIAEEMKIISSLPTGTFLKAAMNQYLA